MDDSMVDYLQIAIIQYMKSSRGLTPAEIQKSLETLGFRVGYSLIEKMIPDGFRLTDEISIMKYICKEFWISLFGKQIDNLRTNNSGIFVLQDNNFRVFSNFTSADVSPELLEYCVAFTSGLIRGVLENLGYPNTVSVDTRSSPLCKFQISLYTSAALAAQSTFKN